MVQNSKNYVDYADYAIYRILSASYTVKHTTLSHFRIQLSSLQFR